MDKTKSKHQSLKRIWDNNLFILRYIFRFTPGYLIGTCFVTCASAVVVFFEHTYCIKYLTDVIQYGQPFQKAILYLAIISTAVAIKIIYCNYFYNYVNAKATEKFNKMIRMDLYEKAVNLDLSCYDDPDFYNDFVWSSSEIGKRFEMTISYVTKLCDSVTWIIASGTLILMLDKIGLIFVAASFLLTTFSSILINKLKYKMDVELKPMQRKLGYIHRVFYLTDYAKEIRLSDIHQMLKSDYDKTSKEMLDSIDRHSKKQVLFGFLDEYLFNSFIFDGIYIMYLLFIAAVKKSISYGSAIALSNSVSNVKHSLKNLAGLIPELQQNSLYIERIRTLLEYTPKIKPGENAHKLSLTPAVLELKKVSFRYRTDSEPVLKNISLKINPGEKVALVGYNGAGKTTLIKLLMRLYDVTHGEIILNGLPIKEYDPMEYRNMYGTVFQDYQIFALNIAENVIMDRITENDETTVDIALQNSGFHEKLQTLPYGIHTPLTKEFDENGVNLSGGEAQKVAIARVFSKNCPIILLDEPSSALDPISEYHLNEAMMRAAENKTVIFISHRLSSTRMADKIYMLEQGEIIEEGSHEELMKRNGKYAQMFLLQAENYKMFA